MRNSPLARTPPKNMPNIPGNEKLRYRPEERVVNTSLLCLQDWCWTLKWPTLVQVSFSNTWIVFRNHLGSGKEGGDSQRGEEKSSELRHEDWWWPVLHGYLMLRSHWSTVILASNWWIDITWLGYCPLIGRDWSRDLDTGLLLAERYHVTLLQGQKCTKSFY